MMLKEKLKEKREDLIKLLPLIAFIIPFLILYLKQDVTFSYSFEATWKGRAFYIFFIWFAVLEMIINWEKLQPKAFKKLKSIRTIALILALLLPTIYVIISNFYGLNDAIYVWTRENYMAQKTELSKRDKQFFAMMMPLAVEYLVFAAFSFLIVFLQYGVDGFRKSLLAPSFLTIIGIVYMIDNLYPYGQFIPFQIPAATTATIANSFLNLMGYRTYISYETDPTWGWIPILYYYLPKHSIPIPVFAIAWPCSGIESLLVYTIFIIVFLKNFEISLMRKIAYFSIGAIVTYLINIFRIITLFIIAINSGYSEEFWRFHDFYAQLISISWIAAYPLLIMMGGDILQKIKSFAEFLKMRLSS